MSFKDKLLDIYRKYDLTATSLSRKLGYSSGEKLLRLTRDANNSPSAQIIEDILKAFPELNARWLLTGEEEMILQEPRSQYGFCKECIKKDAIIEHLEKQLAAKDKRIEELVRGATGQTNTKKKAS